MINEEKVILMTRMASYESGKGKKDITILNYFKGDYIGFQVLKAVIAATISFLMLLAIYFFYNFEVFMQDIYGMDLLAFGKSIIIIYLCTVGAYGVIAYVVFATKYSKAKKSLKTYYGNLKKLAGMYEH